MKAEQKIRHWVEGCPSGKRGFMERAGAKAAARLVAKCGSPGLRPYECPECDNWHIGHKPLAVLRGEISSSEWYAR